MIEKKNFVFSAFDVNTFIIWEDNTKEAMIIDPGCHSEREKGVLSLFVEENQLNVKFLINTHCHIDHIFGNSFVKKTYGCEFFAPEKDIFLLENSLEQAKMFGIEIDRSPLPDQYLTQQTFISIGGISPKFIFTPGHTPGEFCIYFEEDKLCITGDVLFNMSIGRTDLWGGDLATLMNSINEKLLTLPDDVRIFPGHGKDSTILFERKNNPFLNSGYC
jgi:hydroxyacylglutathione hydrolase